MTGRLGLWVSLVALWIAAASVSVVQVNAQRRGGDPVMRIWNGSYSEAQADRGKAAFAGTCSSCHSENLSGGSGPALAGPKFMTKWELEDLNTLFRKIKDTMPRSNPGGLTDSGVVDLVAHILRSNEFPSTMTDLSVDPEVLETFTIVPKSGPTKVVNFALVQAVGCLTPQPGGDWLLQAAVEPTLTRDTAATEAEMKIARETPPGTQTLRLISVGPFKPAAHTGERVHVKGLINRVGPQPLLNVTALQSLGPCPSQSAK